MHRAGCAVKVGLKKWSKAGLQGPQSLSYRTTGMSGLKCCYCNQLWLR
jgi:hypothetical protein